jgi:hypothetical protein
MNQRRAQALLALLGLVGAAALAMVSCSRPDAVWTDADGLLRYVPADTPYLYAVLRPAPDELRDKLLPAAEAMLDSYRTFVESFLEQAAANANLPDRGEAQQRIRAVAEILAELITEEGRIDSGMGREPIGVFYGRGLLPVLRQTLEDGSRFEATIARIESAAGSELPKATLGEHSYRYIENDALRVVIAVQEDQLIVTGMPVGLSDAHLRAVLEGELPRESLAASGKLRELAEKYGFAPFQAGFVDIERLSATFLESPGGSDAELLALAGFDAASMLSETCRMELRELANVAPRVVMGTAALDAGQVRVKGVLELRPDIAAGLGAVAAAVPGLGTSSDGLFAIGMGFDVAAARDFALARLDAIESDPFQCEYFREIQQGVPAARQELSRPPPPYVEDIYGLVMILDEVRGMDLVADRPPTGIDARVLLASDSASSLVAMASGFVPEIAALDLEPDGAPARLPVPPAMGPMVTEAYAALTGQALAVAIGRDAETRLRALLAAPASEPMFLISDLDLPRYYALISDVTAAAAADDPAMPREWRAAMGNLMGSLANGPFDRSRGELRFTEHGVEVVSTVTLRD